MAYISSIVLPDGSSYDLKDKNAVPTFGMGQNLLDNWYFVGGGTGRGVFPINQRGATSISSTGYKYFIDRWYIYRSSGTTYASLSTDGLSLRSSSSSTIAYLRQIYFNEVSNFISGKKCTASALLSDGTLVTGTKTYSASANTTFVTQSVGGSNFTLLGTYSGQMYFEIRRTGTTDVTIAAVKLELGDKQTLCHNEGTEANPVWVLNEIPNYEEELYKCIIQPIEGTSSGVDTYANKNLATTQQIAGTETSATASTNYVVGDLICWNNLLYKVSSAIASGDTLAVGTNLTATTIEDEIEAVSTVANAAVPKTTKVNNKALSSDISLTASDVGAVPTTRTVNSKALSSDITLTASDVSAVPTSRKVNNKALSSDITLSASDVSAVPTTRMVNNKALSADITLSASDVEAAPSNAGLYYGVCGTSATYQDKTVTIDGITELYDGLAINIRFTNAQTYDGTPTLNLNQLGAKSIYRCLTASSSTTFPALRYEWRACEVLTLTYRQYNNYDGWIINNHGLAGTSYYGITKLEDSYSSTSTSTAATPNSVKAAYDLAAGKALIRDGTYYGTSSTEPGTQTKVVTITSSQFPTSLVDGIQIVVLFMNNQTYAGQPYLNVNGTGAKPVILNTSGTAANLRAWIGGGYYTFWYYAAYNDASGAWVLDRGYSTKLLPSFNTTVSGNTSSTGYREIFRIPADNKFSMVLLIENHATEYTNGILSIRIDSSGPYVQWYAKSLKNASKGWSGQYTNIRYEVVDIVTNNTTVSTFILYAYKGTSGSYGLDFTVLSCTNQGGGDYGSSIQWTNTEITKANFLLKSVPIPSFEPPIVSTSISLDAANSWSTEASGYYWDTTTVGTADITTYRFTDNTQVSFNPTPEQLYALIQDGVSALIAETTTISGTLTLRIHALGDVPNTAYQSLSNKAIPITLTEVLAT